MLFNIKHLTYGGKFFGNLHSMQARAYIQRAIQWTPMSDDINRNTRYLWPYSTKRTCCTTCCTTCSLVARPEQNLLCNMFASGLLLYNKARWWQTRSELCCTTKFQQQSSLSGVLPLGRLRHHSSTSQRCGIYIGRTDLYIYI